MSEQNQFDGKKFGANLRDQIQQEIDQSLGARNLRPRRHSGMIPGIILIVVGTLFLLDHMGIIQAEHYWIYWPLTLVAIGLARVFRHGERVIGIGFILVGTVLELHELKFTNLSWNAVWPILLIFAGVQIIWSRFGRPGIPGMPGTVASGGTDTLNEYALFGGVERRVNVNNFRGGSITAIFGGVEVDFRSADIEGEEANIFVEAIFGGVEITVPERWIVTFQGQSVFAGYSDETRQPLPDAPGAPPRKMLVLHGRAVFGGITVKN
jgi:predicted membrane protein